MAVELFQGLGFDVTADRSAAVVAAEAEEIAIASPEVRLATGREIDRRIDLRAIHFRELEFAQCADARGTKGLVLTSPVQNSAHQLADRAAPRRLGWRSAR